MSPNKKKVASFVILLLMKKEANLCSELCREWKLYKQAVRKKFLWRLVRISIPNGLVLGVYYVDRY